MSNLRAQGRHILAAVCGAAAIFTRQTNIIWVLLEITLVVWEVFKKDLLSAIMDIWDPPPPPPPPKRRPGRPSLRPQPPPPVPEQPSLFKLWVKLFKEVFPDVWGYGLVVVCFIVFVCINGGVALGDKESHKVVLNIPQFIYFALFCAFFMSPVLFFTMGATVRTLKKNWLYFILACLLGFIIVQNNTVAHLYLLSDNRHYTFYIWKLYERYSAVKYALVPVAMVAWTAILTNLDACAAIRFSYMFSIFGLLVPNLLLEFRYFITPYFFIRLNSKNFEWKVIVPEFFLYFLINLITFHTFLYKPFYWPDSNDVQRFMW